jgi:hypothetical protein
VYEYNHIGELEPSPTPPKDDSDKLTPDQVKQFEREHKLLFIYLAITNNTYANLFNKGLNSWINAGTKGSYLDSPAYQPIKRLGQTILIKAKGWYETQQYLEQTAKIPKVAVTINDFLQYKKRSAILNQANTWIDKSGHVSGHNEQDVYRINCPCNEKKIGIGIIPLIIWGVIAIVSAISAAYIVNRMTTTTQDREDLLKQSEQTCKDLNLTAQQCADVVTTTQKEETKNAKAVTDTASAVVGGFKGILLIGGGLLITLAVLKSKKS